MPRGREFLERFRPVGTPGAAAAGEGVPADRRAELAAELEPVLALLADTQREAARLRDEADAYARRQASEAASAATIRLARARRTAEEERVAAAAALARAADAEAVRTRAAAEQQARSVLSAAARRLPELLARVGERLDAELDGLGPPTGGEGTQ
ncbi:MAG TPA: hypothetical protein VF314_03025 [Actinomycetes bacterium]